MAEYRALRKIRLVGSGSLGKCYAVTKLSEFGLLKLCNVMAPTSHATPTSHAEQTPENRPQPDYGY